MKNDQEIKTNSTQNTRVPKQRPQSSKTVSKTTIFRAKMDMARPEASNMKPDHSLDKELLQGIQKLGCSLNHVIRTTHNHSSNMKITTPSIEDEK